MEDGRLDVFRGIVPATNLRANQSSGADSSTVKLCQSSLLLNSLHRRIHTSKLALSFLCAQMSLKRVRAAAPYRTRHELVQRECSRSLGFGVDSREVLEVLVLRLRSAGGCADGFALESGGVRGRLRAGMVVLWGC